MDVPDRALRSALEFAVDIAAAGSKLRPALPYPAGLKPYLKFAKLPGAALATVRQVVEADDEYRRRLGIAVSPELVDPVGILWLQRPDGWEASIAEALAASAAAEDEAKAESELRREQRRREAAESAAARARLEVVELRETLDRERAAAAEAAAEAERDGRELRRAESRVRELEKAARKGVPGDDIDALRAELAEAVAARDAALADRAGSARSSVDAERLRVLLHEALSLTAEATPAARKAKRKPLSIPGGLFGDSAAAAEHLLRSPGVTVLVDGYNVAKLGWPDLTLERQREQCIALAEGIARRWGTMLHVVFDGASVVGAHTRARRLVRVTFSPEGVIADDVLRAEVDSLDPRRPVVVVTNDQAVVADVRAAGANTVASDAFLAVGRTL